MTNARLEELTVGQLVERFTEITLDQDKALRTSKHAKFNRLFEEMEAVKGELRRRDGDQRRCGPWPRLYLQFEQCRGHRDG